MVDLTRDALVLGQLFNGKKVETLTRNEMAIFYFLGTQEKGATWRDIVMFVWGSEDRVQVKTLSVHLFNLRKKIVPMYQIVHDPIAKTYRLEG